VIFHVNSARFLTLQEQHQFSIYSIKTSLNITPPLNISKLLVIFDATSEQGPSIIHHVITSPRLSSSYEIRATTRFGSEVYTAPSALNLKSKYPAIELFAANATNLPSVKSALKGAHTVFATIDAGLGLGESTREIEFEFEKYIVDTAISQGVKLFIWGTDASPSEISGGNYTRLISSDARAKLEKYLMQCKDMDCVSYCSGVLMENFKEPHHFAPAKDSDSVWTLMKNCSGDTKLPLIDAISDDGEVDLCDFLQPRKIYR
jgi:hypothetical protein